MFFNYLVNCCTIAFTKNIFWDLSQVLFCVFFLFGDPFREFNPDFILHCDSWDLSELFRSAAAMGPSALPTTLIGPLNFVGTIAALTAIACPAEPIMKSLPLKPIFTPPPSTSNPKQRQRCARLSSVTSFHKKKKLVSKAGSILCERFFKQK